MTRLLHPVLASLVRAERLTLLGLVCVRQVLTKHHSEKRHSECCLSICESVASSCYPTPPPPPYSLFLTGGRVVLKWHVCPFKGDMGRCLYALLNRHKPRLLREIDLASSCFSG